MARCEMVDINDELYLKVESMGWQPSVGVYAIRVAKDGQEFVAVKPRGGKSWRLWTEQAKTLGWSDHS